MSFTILFNGEKKEYQNPVQVLDIVGHDKSIVCASINNRVRELTYMVDKDSTIVPLTVKDRDAKTTYEASVRFIVAMAMYNIHPEVKIRFSYNVSRAIFMQILNPEVITGGHLAKELDAEIKRIIAADYPLVRHIVSKEEIKKIFKDLWVLDMALNY